MSTSDHIFDQLTTEPFPQRGATAELERRMVGFLREARPEPGSPLGTDEQLVSATNLSRSTVRRVMERLDRDGWVDRQAGRGTFVGSRVLMLDETGEPDAKSNEDARAIASAIEAQRRSDFGEDAYERQDRSTESLRMAVLITRIEDLAHDWFSLGVIAGMHAAANEVNGRVEISGTRETRPRALAQRLGESRPDALAFLACAPEYLSLLDVSQRLGFPTILANTAFMRPGSSSVVCEDNTQGTRLAVDHLVDQGHQRIGIVLNRWPEPWVFERHRAFEEALADRGCDSTACAAGWIDVGVDIEGINAKRSDELERQDRDCADRLMAYIERERPTAIVAGAQTVSRAFGRLVTDGRLSVPGDVSVVCFDQHPSNAVWYGTEPTTIELPLHAMGRNLFDVAEQLRRDHDPRRGADQHRTIQRRLPCKLKSGNTVEARL